MALTILLLIIGLVLIIKGGDWFVDAASWVAERTGIPKIIIGATIVSLATTLPEILVSIIAATQGQVDMAIGNAVGSVTANLGLIMGIAIVCMPSKKPIIMREYIIKFALLLISAICIVIGGFMGGVNLPLAIVMLTFVIVFLADNLLIAKKEMKTEKKAKKTKLTKKIIIWNIVKFVLGSAGIVGGAELLVQSGTDLAAALGIDERIVSVTIIAIGTSLPELVTTITAIIKKESALGFGNVLGANIIDLALIMPLCAIISGQNLPISANAARIDLPACLVIAAIAIIPTIFTRKFQRWQGVLMLLAYATYMVITCFAVA